MENKIIFISPDGKGYMFDFMLCKSKPFCAFIPDFCSFMVFKTSIRRIVFNYTIFGKEKDNYGINTPEYDDF